VSDYLAGDVVAERPGFADLTDSKLRQGVPKTTSKQVLFDSVLLLDDEGKPSDVFFEGDALTIQLGLASSVESRRLEALCFVRSIEGVLVFTLTSGMMDVDLQPGSAELRVTIPRNQLRTGRYTLDLYVLTASPQDYLLGAIGFEVVASREPDGDPRRMRDNLGLVTVEQEWGELRQGEPNRV
jgi:Wzt-like putative exopolysaccharide export protein